MPAYGFATNGQSEWNYSFIKALKGVSSPDARLLFRSSFQLSRLQPKYKYKWKKSFLKKKKKIFGFLQRHQYWQQIKCFFKTFRKQTTQENLKCLHFLSTYILEIKTDTHKHV